MIEQIELQARFDRLFSGLTTPRAIDEYVRQFTQRLGGGEPMFLPCRPEPWSRQDCCDANVARYIKIHGGRMLCGYRLWYTEPLYIEGERHAVWTDGQEIRDVSFVVSGETQTLFVPDDKTFDALPAKVRHAFDSDDQAIVVIFEEMERQGPRVERSSEAAWDHMLSYEDWLSGKR